MTYKANHKRYSEMQYRNCGSSGLKLPLISLGLWHNFGGKTINPESKKVLFKAFDLGITHFDLANNYGPPYGSAETNFGKVMKTDLKKYRDELIISSKAGYDMWDGPYGEWGSKKHIIASCDQSLKRMNLDYVDIFYSHRFDPNTPLEETADALESIYRSGKAQYIGVSSYSSKKTNQMFEILKSRNIKILIHQPSYSLINRWIEKDLTKTLLKKRIGCIAFSPLAQGMLSEKYLKGIPKISRANQKITSLDKILIHQPSYSLINRWIEKDLTKTLLKKGIGCIAFSPLAQGMLSEKYLKGIPKISRANQKITSLDKSLITKKNIKMINELNSIAKKRGQSLSQMALAWTLNNKAVTSALIGVRNLKQLKENVASLNNLNFTKSELSLISKKARDGNVNLWLASSSH